MAAHPAKPKEIDERQRRGWRMLKRFQAVLARVRAGLPRTARASHGLRHDQAEEYLSLLLLAMFNPVLGSLRGLCQASRLHRVQEQCQSAAISLSRFSEAQEVFDPELVRLALSDLVAARAPQLAASHGGWPPGALQIIDSTLWKVVPRMQWAQWRFQHVEQRAVRLHLKLRVQDQAPTEAKITMGKTCERAAWRQMARPGEISIGDRSYGGDLGMLTQMVALGGDFLVRLRHAIVIHWQSTESLDAQDQAAGIVQAGMARLGSKQAGPWRVIILERPGPETLLLAGSACWEKLSAREVAEVYRHRGKIELFFRCLISAAELVPLSSLVSLAIVFAGRSQHRRSSARRQGETSRANAHAKARFFRLVFDEISSRLRVYATTECLSVVCLLFSKLMPDARPLSFCFPS